MFRLLLAGLLVASALAAACACASQPEVDDYDGGPRCEECPLVAVTRVLDGDTLDTSAGRVRLYGVDTPEAGEECARSATKSLRDMAGREVRLEGGPRPRDVFGRRLAYVYRKDGRSIDAALVWAGYAVAWPEDGQHRAAFAELERDARSAGRGCLW